MIYPFFWVTLFSSLIAFTSLPLLYVVDITSISSIALFLIFISSICSTASAITSAYVLKHLDVSESASLFALSPILITILSIVFLGENLSIIQLIGIGISCIGIFILEGHRHYTKQTSHDSALAGTLSHIDIPEETRASKTKIYSVLISALIFFSSNAVLDKYIIDEHAVNPIYLLVLIQLCILLNFIILHVYTRKEKTKSSFDLSLVYQKSFWVHIFFVITHRVTHVLALREIGVALLHTIKQFSAVLTTILGGKLFTEKHMIRRTTACLCIVTGVILAIL
mgnify:CR=1 FL=1